MDFSIPKEITEEIRGRLIHLVAAIATHRRGRIWKWIRRPRIPFFLPTVNLHGVAGPAKAA